MVRPERKTKGSLTLRAPDLVALSREQWAARFGGKPVADVLCTGTWCAVGPHVHPARRPVGGRLLSFAIDPRTGRWVRPGEPVGS